MINRAVVIDKNFATFCQSVGLGPKPNSPQVADGHSERDLRQLFESQLISRHLDLMARELRKDGRGYYTIGSSGHEGNAVLGRVLRFSDPAFLHYRSGALMVERARQVPRVDAIRDTLLSFMASSRDPISGGRHKVWGSVPLAVPPQTSTIASHLPRAVGAALALERCTRLGIQPIFGDHGPIPGDSIVLCNFGDATANHSVAQGAFNSCEYWVQRGTASDPRARESEPRRRVAVATAQASDPRRDAGVSASQHRGSAIPQSKIKNQKSKIESGVPILWVCEDNGIGISVHTPPDWIETAFRHRPNTRYFTCDGCDLIDTFRAAREAVEFVRTQRRPAFLHMRLVRLMGHAGTDPETEYHSLAEIESAEARDPLLASARLMIESGYMTPAEVVSLYEDVRARVKAAADALGTPPLLTSAAQVVAPLAPYHPDEVMAEATRVANPEARLRAFALDSTPHFAKTGDVQRLPEFQPAKHFAAVQNWGLRDLMAKYPEMSVFGEDVAERGGVYYVTAGLNERFGPDRCFNTLLDETSILGMAIGAGHLGLLPAPEIQYLAYVHNAIDQLRGEACSSSFFSNGQFRNPMVVRVQALGYQKGFGGHFHNDNSTAALREIPGLILAVPSRGDDAVKMLRTCFALARVDGRVVAFLEPIALYMTKDLYETGDGAWLCSYPPPDEAIALGEAGVYAPNPDDPSVADLVILTYGNGVYMSLRAAWTLSQQHGLRVRVVDLRWLSPLNEDLIADQAASVGRVLVVDEGRRSGGVAEAILAVIHERCGGSVVARRLTGMDTYVPLGPAANLVIPTEADVVREAVAVCRGAKV